jgi:hypothetical protein
VGADGFASLAMTTPVTALAKGDDYHLCHAIKEVMAGQAVDLGGGVYKKRLNKNQHRSIILAKGGEYWIYEYLFAKNDRDNIDEAELEMFRQLAKGYEGLKKSQLAKLIEDKHLLEICHDDKKEI